MFFLDDQLCRRRVKDIKFISTARTELRDGTERWVHDIAMADGAKLVVLDVTVQQISRVPVHTFSAEPGLKVWSPDHESKDDFLQPIVGWGVTMDGNVLPITAGGSIDEQDVGAVIIASDGSVWQNGFVQAPNLVAFKQLQADARL